MSYPEQSKGHKPVGLAVSKAVPAGSKKPPGVNVKRPAGPPGKLPPRPLSPERRSKPSKSGVETIKEQSDGLRGNLAQALQEDSDHFGDKEKQLVKFHGIYQQDDRDRRQGGRTYIFMVRSKLPGGSLSADQYLVQDALSDRYGDGTLRITTRQDFQMHGVIKGDLKSAVRELNENLVTTLGACGDVVRNVVFSPVPAFKLYEREIERIALQISNYLLPRTRAYHEIWIDGEKVVDGKEAAEETEPIYGKNYLPRKFKIGIAPPGDNSIDVYTQDVGLIAVVEGEELVGFNVLVGGGLGMTHKKPETFPRLADPLAFITPEETIPVIEQIVFIQRDHGDRADRRHARLKYLIHEWGLERFKKELEGRLGYRLKPVAPTPPLELELYLGWHEQGEGKWYIGISVENGRIKDEGDLLLKTGLREIVSRYRPGVRLTPSQDLLLTDVNEDDREKIDELLARYGIRQEYQLSNARKYAMACPALPTCGLAITESERIFPRVIDQFEVELAQLGLSDERITIRMTGCPNGCARPYVADIGFVGRSLDQYTIFLGGRSDGTRLNEPFKDLVPLNELVPTLRPLFVAFRSDRRPGESFGDFCYRLGIETLRSISENQEVYVQVS